MKKIDYRIVIGSTLILGGILMLLDKLGFLSGAADYFWVGVLAIGAVIFLVMFLSNPNKWWAAIPGFSLAGMAASVLLFDRLGWDDLVFLGGIGLGFWASYLRDTRRWWAIIPGGVLLTLGATAALSEVYKLQDTGGVLMVGLGITFLLVALLAKMRWAYIPAAILLFIGFLLELPSDGLLEYALIAILLLGGITLVIGSFRK